MQWQQIINNNMKKRNLKSFNAFHKDKLFLEKRKEELSNESESTKKWKQMQESVDIGWSEFRGTDDLMDTYVKYCTGLNG